MGVFISCPEFAITGVVINFLEFRKVQSHMTLARFWKIWSNLHVVDNSTLLPSDGLTAKIKPVLDIWGNTFFSSYSPGQEMCLITFSSYGLTHW